MEEIRQEQLRNMQLKDRRPQRLAPLHLREDNDEEIGEGLQEMHQADYETNQMDDAIDHLGPNHIADLPNEEEQHTQN